MFRLLPLFMRLALLQGSPADLPHGRAPLGFAVLLMLLCNTLVTYTWYGPAVGLFTALVEVLLNGGFLYLCLSLRERRARFEQCLTAISGVGAVMALVMWPWALALSAGPEEIPPWVVLGQVVLVMWTLLVWARVLRLACDFDRVSAASLALAFYFFSAVVVSSLLSAAV